MFRQAFLRAVSLAVSLACVCAHAGQRAFVASTGNDANVAGGCTLAAPCRTFQVAHQAVDDGGEIVALDAAGYAPVSVTKSVSIIGNPGYVASIAVASGNGVNIGVAGVRLVLRNLTINGTGGNHGVNMTNGISLALENCVISNMAGDGVHVQSSSLVDVEITDSVMRGNFNGAALFNSDITVAGSRFLNNNNSGLTVFGFGGGSVATASVSDSVAAGSGIGFQVVSSSLGIAQASFVRSTASHNSVGFHNETNNAGSTATTTVGLSMSTHNTTGFKNSAVGGGTPTFESLGNNILRQNTANTSGTITPVGSS